MPSSASVTAEVQPRFGPSMTASMTASMAAEAKSAPSMSKREPGSRRPARSGTTVTVAAIATTASGTFTQKTEPQKKWASSRPLRVGPTTMPIPAMLDHSAIAPARSRAGNTAVRIDSVAGMTNAPPTPISARAAISVAESPDRAAQAEPEAKMTRPSSSARRRPNRSPSAPAMTSSAANVSV